MSKSSIPTEMVLSLDLDLPPQVPSVPSVPSEPVDPVAESAPTEERDAEGRLLLRRVRVNPVHLARGITLMSVFAAENGLTNEERGRLSVFVRENDILIASDLDRGITRTADERERPLRLRYRVPLTGEGEGAAVQVGAVVRATDPVLAVRSSVTNSENFGLLSDEHDVILEVFADSSEEHPERFVVRAPAHGVKEPRAFAALAGADLSHLSEVEPQLASHGLSGLDSDVLVEIASHADPEIGLRLFVPEEGAPGHLVSVGEQGMMLCRITLAEGESGARQQLSLIGEAEAEVDERSNADGRGGRDGDSGLTQDVILSRRLALTVGMAQGAFEGAMKTKQKDDTNQHQAHILTAALAAALDVHHSELLPMLQREVAGKAVREAWAAARTKRGDAVRAISFAQSLLGTLEPGEAERLVSILSVEAAGRGVAPERSLEALRAQTQSEPEIALALEYIAVDGDVDRLDEALTPRYGDARLVESALDMLRHLPGDRALQRRSLADYAVAAVRLQSDRAPTLVKTLLPRVPETEARSWWARFAAHIESLDVPSEAADAIQKGASASKIPSISDLAIPSSIRETWIRNAKSEVQGRFWAEEDGRVVSGFGHPDVGVFMISDLAEQPDPERYPVGREDVASATDRRMDTEWKVPVWSSDLEWATDRVAALSEPRHMSRTADTLFVARWTPSGSDDSPTGRALDHFPRLEDKIPLAPESVQLGEGDEADDYVVERNPKEPVEGDAVAGTLRVFGVHAGGERLHLKMPMKAAPATRGGKPFAFAVDGGRLHFFAGYVARKGRYSIIEVGEGVVRIADQNLSRVSVFPALGSSRVPARMRALVAAAGVPAQAARPVSLASVFERVRESRELQRETFEGRPPRMAPNNEVSRVVQSIVWPAADPGSAPSAVNRVHEQVLQLGATPEQAVAQIEKRIRHLQEDKAIFEARGVVAVEGLFGESEMIVLRKGERARRTALKQKNAQNRIGEINKELESLRLALAQFQDFTDEQPVADCIREGTSRLRKVPSPAHLDEGSRDSEAQVMFSAEDEPDSPPVRTPVRR